MPGSPFSTKVLHQPVLQGVTGIVTQISGNQMPKVGRPMPKPKAYPTTVFFYEPTHISQVTQINQLPLYTVIHTKLIASVKTDSTGAFTKALPVGVYSVFIKAGNNFFANMYDTQNNIALVKVEAGKLTDYKIVLNNAAAY